MEVDRGPKKCAEGKHKGEEEGKCEAEEEERRQAEEKEEGVRSEQKVGQEKEQKEKSKGIGKWKIVFKRNGGHKGGIGQKHKRKKAFARGEISIRDTLRKIMERRQKRRWRLENIAGREVGEIRVMSQYKRRSGNKGERERPAGIAEPGKPEILMIQEAKTMEGDIEKLRVPPEYEKYAPEIKASTRHRQRGVITLIKRNLASRVEKEEIIKTHKEGYW